MNNGLYHKDIYLPKVELPGIDVVLNYTYHALDAARNDRYGTIELPETINFGLVQLIELEVVDGKPFKAVIRQHHDSRNDLVIVVLLNGYRVKTVWLNRKNDRHRTLDRSKYNSR